MKVCKKCHIEKISNDFYQDKKTKDGLKNVCKMCISEINRQKYRDNPDIKKQRNREWYKANTEKHKERSREWKKDNPEKVREVNSQWRKANYDKIRERNKKWKRANSEKVRETSRQWQRNNPEKVREINIRWRKVNPQKIKKIKLQWRRNNPEKDKIYKSRRYARKYHLPNVFTEQNWKFALEYFNYSCAVCGRPRGLFHTLATDHWIPLSDPRPDNPGTVAANIVPLCHGDSGCNNSKWNTDPDEWLIKKFGKRRATQISKRIQEYFLIVSEANNDLQNH